MLSIKRRDTVFYRFSTTIRQQLQRLSVITLLLLMPTAVFWFFGRPSSLAVTPILSMPAYYLSDLAILGLLFTHRPSLTSEKTQMIDIAWLAVCLIACLTVISALAPHYAVYSAVRWALAFLVYRILLHTPLTSSRMVTVFVIGLALQSVLGLAQATTRMHIGLPGEPFRRIYDLWRATGMTFHPNVLAGYLVVALLLTLPLLHRKWMLPIWWLLWAGWYATASRSSGVALLLTLPVALGWMFWFRPISRRILILAIVGAAAVLWYTDSQGIIGVNRYVPNKDEVPILLKETPSSTAVAIAEQDSPANSTKRPVAATSVEDVQPTPVIKTEGNSTTTVETPPAWLTTQTARVEAILKESYAINYRWRQNEIAFGIIAARPLHGIGAGNFPLSMIGNTSFDNEGGPHNTHNVPLLLASEIGIWGGGIWLFLSLLGAWWLVRYWRAQNVWLIVGLCAWFALVGEGMFEYYPWGLETGRLLTMFVWAIIGRTLLTNTNSSKSHNI